MFHLNMEQNMISRNEELSLHFTVIVLLYLNLILKINFYLFQSMEYPYGIIFIYIYIFQSI